MSETQQRPAWTSGDWFHVIRSSESGELGDIMVADGDADADGRTVDASYPILEDGSLTDVDRATNEANLRMMAGGLRSYEALVRLKAALVELGVWMNTSKRQDGSLWKACYEAEVAMEAARSGPYSLATRLVMEGPMLREEADEAPGD